MAPLFAFLTTSTMILLGIVGVLIFGRRLPELARSLGKSMAEFKQGMGGLERGFDDVANPSPNVGPTAAPAEPVRPPQRVAPTAPKFDDENSRFGMKPGDPPITPK
jgi:sec-independent protein translocase protein TatA